MSSTLPDQLFSLATVKYLGYDDEAASQIWNKWTAQAPGVDPVPECIPLGPFELTFMDYVVGCSYGHRYDPDLNAHDDDDAKWYECMDRCGINKDTRDAIMDPVFRHTRLTESCIFWIRNTIEFRYEALKSSIQEASREMEQASPEDSTSQGTSRGGIGARSDSETIRMTPWVSQDTAMSEAALCATNAPGSLTLYRGMERSRLTTLFDSNGNLDNIRALSSRPPTDFDGRGSSYCFVVDRDVAIEYAAFTKRRSDRSTVVIVHATFENSTIEGLSEDKFQRIYWPSEEWKRLIFFSRSMKRLPSDLGKFNQASLIIGTLSARPSLAYVKMKCYTEITEDMVSKNAARRDAVQYAFLGDEGEELFEKAELKVFPITPDEFSQWHKKAQEEMESRGCL
ncbi:uncharacterized protein Triagg1_176 [Trichoderma aggressivum f. europaeum]|uniref:Uncharacterized protein n=1 Tax=Trichoderma aggressivum f. europaeum TaxID=173218 RepID=A0AAE1IKZ6_9HYPO|nr:hypothetical protein Triagg1_176 [Trichoderma aggressivum f. europaeum]